MILHLINTKNMWTTC